MKKIEATGPMRIPIYNWAGSIEDAAMQQAENLAQFPYAFHHIALMPDCHSGYGMPIGGVLATNTVVIPNAVGVDIGCGMLSVRVAGVFRDAMTPEVCKEKLKRVFGGSKEYPGGIRSSIPVGFNHHSKRQDDKWLVEPGDGALMPIVNREFEASTKQIGTLGGGNHFIEFQYDCGGNMWFTIHSGSRNLGHKVATHYNEIAKSKKDSFYAEIPPGWDLAYLPVNSTEGAQYIAEMEYCRDFAFRNRALMAERVQEAISEQFPVVRFDEQINIAHNYVQLEEHFGQYVWVHRKGATLALPNTRGIIPGSQGTSTYIVEGTGNKDSFFSCSHGAGRVMSRTAARKQLNLGYETEKLESAGVLVHGLRQQNDLDEAPGAYKDIAQVMEYQKDLVKVVHTLKPIACMKG